VIYNCKCNPKHKRNTLGYLTEIPIYVTITRLRGLFVSSKKPSTLDDFKLFYEELSFASKFKGNRVRRSRLTK